MKIQCTAHYTLNGDEIELIAMQEGDIQGRGQYLSAEALTASLPAFERVWLQNLVFASGEQEHLSGAVRAQFPNGVILGNVVGVADSPRIETIDGKASVVQRGAIADTALKHLLTLAAAKGKLADIGLSINGSADDAHIRRGTRNGRAVAEILQIDRIESIDFVTHPGAGGRVRQLLASLTPDTGASPMLINKLKTYLQQRGISYTDDPSPLNIIASAQAGDAEALILASVSDSLKAGLDAVADRVLTLAIETAPKPEPVKASAQEPEKKPEKTPDEASDKEPEKSAPVQASADMDAKTRELDLRLSALRVQDALNAADLPQGVKTLLASRYKDRVVSETDIAADIQAQREVLALVTDQGKPKTFGRGVAASVGLEPRDKVQQAADQLCGVRPELFRDAVRTLTAANGYPAEKMPDTFGVQASAGDKLPDRYSVPAMGLRDLYVACTGDTEISFDFRSPRRRSVMATAVTESAPFGDALGTSLNRRLLQDWMMKELDWRKIATIKPGGFKDFRAQEIIHAGGFGELATVADDGEYQEISLPDDSKETYTPITKGNLLPITRRTVLRDDVGLVNRLIASLRRAAQYTFHKAFFYRLANYVTAAVNDGTMADSKSVYHADHSNLVSGAYNYANLKAARLLMRQQTEKGSGIWLDLTPRYHVLPISYEDSGLVYLTSDRLPGDMVNDANTIRLNPADVIVVDDSLLGGSATYAYLVADPMDYETLEVAFMGNQQVPEIFIQNDPTVGDTFKQDRFTWKIRFEYGIGLGDYRGLVRLGA